MAPWFNGLPVQILGNKICAGLPEQFLLRKICAGEERCIHIAKVSGSNPDVPTAVFMNDSIAIVDSVPADVFRNFSLRIEWVGWRELPELLRYKIQK